MDSSFRLSPAIHQAIYIEEIEPAYFMQAQPVSEPKIVVIAGQTGVGKSKVVSITNQELGLNAVPITTDAMREFHPKYDEIVSMDDKHAAERTHEDASQWAQALLQNAITTRRNIILEGVFRDGEKLVSVIHQAKAKGYLVVVRFVAAHERYSVWGINVRYEREKAKRGYGRFAPLSYHDECYRNLLCTASQVECQSQADIIEVFNRNGERLYHNRQVGGLWEQAEGAKTAIQKERSRTLNANERASYAKDWDEILQRMEKRLATPEEIAMVKQLSKRFIDEMLSGSE